MNTKDFKKAVELVVKEKGISEDVIYDAMELALTAAYKKNYNSTVAEDNPTKKWTDNLYRYFSKEDTEVAIMHMKICSV